MRFAVSNVQWHACYYEICLCLCVSCVAARSKKPCAPYNESTQIRTVSTSARFIVCVQWRWTDSDACFAAVVPFVWKYYRKLALRFFCWPKENACFVLCESRSTGVAFQLFVFSMQSFTLTMKYLYLYWNVSVCRYKVRISNWTYRFRRQFYSQHCPFWW